MSTAIKNKLKGGLEPRVYDKLLTFKDKNFVVEYETEKLEYSIPGNYCPDFPLTVDGHKVYLEVKGYFDDQALKKMDAVTKAYPELDIRMVFEKDNKLSRRKRKKYSDWCNERNIPWILLKNLTKDWIKIRWAKVLP